MIKQESTATIASSSVRPKKKIATLQVCFLEYNARSLNGRIYPKATCDAIYQSALEKLADPNGLAVTSFVSHEAANGNANTELVGGVSRIWQEGNKFYADIDLADTRAGHDILALAEGRYLRSESMRVLGVELAHDRAYDLPLVVVQEGAKPELLGIDLTTRPGLMDTARIQQVLYEAAASAPYTESFSLLDAVVIQSKEEAPVSIPLYLKVILEEGMTADRQAHQRIHDNLAGVLDATVKAKHGDESARFMALVESELTEEGRAIAVKHAVKIAAAHDDAAKQCGMECAGCYNDELGIALDPDGDGTPDNEDPADQGDESTKKGKKPMTEAEMLAALAAKGYNVTPPKTVEEQLAELRTLSEAQAAQIEALKTAPPQRQTLASSAMNETGGYAAEPLYEEGEYLAGPLAPATWKSLANRRVPWPQNIDPRVALKELAPFMAFRLLENEANAMGRSVDAYVEPHERV